MDEQAGSTVEELTLEPRQRWSAPAASGAVGRPAVVGRGRRCCSWSPPPATTASQVPGLPVDLARRPGPVGATPTPRPTSMLAWVTYVPGDDLPALGGEAHRLPPARRRSTRRRCARSPTRSASTATSQSDGDGSWSVTGEGGGGRLDVYAGGGACWSYFAGDPRLRERPDGPTGCGSLRDSASSAEARCPRLQTSEADEQTAAPENSDWSGTTTTPCAAHTRGRARRRSA